mmetsp:Transcript_41800/g.135242  ORF Transcript_41800/g.135242 Transcript_41800/m.135242 type:complete len:244 (-) Transcript_41800:582-1313(-)
MGQPRIEGRRVQGARAHGAAHGGGDADQQHQVGQSRSVCALDHQLWQGPGLGPFGVGDRQECPRLLGRQRVRQVAALRGLQFLLRCHRLGLVWHLVFQERLPAPRALRHRHDRHHWAVGLGGVVRGLGDGERLGRCQLGLPLGRGILRPQVAVHGGHVVGRRLGFGRDPLHLGVVHTVEDCHHHRPLGHEHRACELHRRAAARPRLQRQGCFDGLDADGLDGRRRRVLGFPRAGLLHAPLQGA